MNNNSLNNPKRLQLAIVLAVIAHLLFFSISFAIKKQSSAAQPLNITLNQRINNSNNIDSEYLAQFTQQASGDLDSKEKITSPDDSEMNAELVQQQAKRQLAQDSATRAEDKVIFTQENSRFQLYLSKTQQAKEKQQQLTGLNENANQLAEEIASLEAQLDPHRQTYSTKARVHRLSSVATKASEDANYLYAWQKRIEQLGNQHYPEEALRRGIFGELRLLVVLKNDGNIHDVKVLKSSGHSILDNSAKYIVFTAAPFPELPSNMKKNYQYLEIIRTWNFKRGAFSGN